jgi:hypothetical protein
MSDIFATSPGLRKAVRESLGPFDWIGWGITTLLWGAGLITALLILVRSATHHFYTPTRCTTSSQCATIDITLYPIFTSRTPLLLQDIPTKCPSTTVHQARLTNALIFPSTENLSGREEQIRLQLLAHDAT